MTIPGFDPVTGLLPPGEHVARWDEVQERLGWNLHRRRLLDGLHEGLAALGAAGCSCVWLNGSFVTVKEEPNDFDAVWSVDGVDRAMIEAELPELLVLRDHRAEQKRRFGGEFFPNVTEGGSGKRFSDFFQSDRDGIAKGIVVIDPSKETWE